MVNKLGFTTKEERANLPGGKNNPYVPSAGTYVQTGSSASDPLDVEKITCEKKGGIWDELTRTCKLPQKEENQYPGRTVLTNADTGKPSGFLDSQGNFVKAGREDIQNVVNKENASLAPIEGGTTIEQYQDIKRKIALAGQVGQIDMATAMQAEEQGINVKEVLNAGITGINPINAGIGFAAGAAKGSAVFPGLGTVAGGLLGAGVSLLGGFYSDVTKNIKNQRGDLVSGKVTELKKRTSAMNNYISAANSNPAAAGDYIQAFNVEKSLIMRDYNTLVKDGEENLVAWGSDATAQRIQYEVFFESVLPSMEERLNQAVLKPDPTRAYISVENIE